MLRLEKLRHLSRLDSGRSLSLVGMLVVSACMANAGYAQQGVGVAVSPVPVWRAGQAIPTSLDGQYVYFAPKSDQIVMVYPEHLGAPEFEKDPGAINVRRIELKPELEATPELSVDVRSMEGDGYVYSYRISNPPDRRYGDMILNTL